MTQKTKLLNYIMIILKLSEAMYKTKQGTGLRILNPKKCFRDYQQLLHK